VAIAPRPFHISGLYFVYFRLGQHANVALLSEAEGDDKPTKYPVMFCGADLVLIIKSDLLPVLDDFSPERAEGHVRALANEAGILTVSARKPGSLTPWLVWLERGVRDRKLTNPKPAAAIGAEEGHALRSP
jgi:hydrogenase nickel incorporation protein HypB